MLSRYPSRPARMLMALPVLLAACASFADVQLASVPVRDRVVIHLDHAQATLVEETRTVPLSAGANRVAFTWTHTRIDRHSAVLRMLAAPDATRVVSVSYPPDEQAVVWTVSAARAGPARVRIAYLVDGLQREYGYRAVLAAAEQSLDLSQYLRVTNRTGEDFGDGDITPGVGAAPIRGSVAKGETRQWRVNHWRDVPVTKRYIADPMRYGYQDAAERQLRIPMQIELLNTPAAGLGAGPLPGGTLRLFKAADDGSALLGEDRIDVTPVTAPLRIGVGVVQDVAVVRRMVSREQTPVEGALYHVDAVVRYTLRNFKPESVTLELVETLSALRAEAGIHNARAVAWELGDDTTLSAGLDRARSHADRLVWRLSLAGTPPGETPDTIIERLHVRFKHEW